MTVQVQLTEFASDSYPLSIEPKSLDAAVAFGVAAKVSSPSRLVGGEAYDLRGRLTQQDQPDGTKKGVCLRISEDGTVGASCLSIIGMIKPGCTVRLYRQVR